MALRRLAYWLLQAAGSDPAIETRVEDALAHGFTASGLPIHALKNDFNLMGTGKFHEVAHYAALALGDDLRTVGDLRRLFHRAHGA